MSDIQCHVPHVHYVSPPTSLLQLISSQDIAIFGIQEVRLHVNWPPSSSDCQVCQLAHYLPGYQVGGANDSQVLH